MAGLGCSNNDPEVILSWELKTLFMHLFWPRSQVDPVGEASICLQKPLI